MSKLEDGTLSTRSRSPGGDADAAELARMGYKQELKRELGLLQNFGVSFSIISVITGVPSLFLYGLNTGGPAVMVWGWFVVSVFTMIVGLAMAEICSAHPTSGGPYYWAAMLSSHKRAPLASWVTGWFNLLGQVAVTTGISFACANFLSTAATLGTDFVPTPKTTIGIYAAVLCAQGLINTLHPVILKHLNTVSIYWHAIGTTALVIAVLAAAPTHQSGKFVFTEFVDNTGVDGGGGWSQRASIAYVVVIGILMSQYSLTGFDASAHMTEETTNPSLSGPLGIIMAIGVSAVLGWFLIIGLLFSIQDLDAVIGSETGQPVTQIFLDTVGDKGAIVLMVIVIGAMFFCGTFSITSNSRMMYAFARDGGIPGHSFFATVDKKGVPVRTVWLACTLSFCLALPSLGSAVAFSAATSIATIGLYISYGIPIFLNLLSHIFQRFPPATPATDQSHPPPIRGPFSLMPFTPLVALVSVLWILFIAVAFVLPTMTPVDRETLNYAAVAVGIVVTYCFGMWLVSARKWFTGPIRYVGGDDGPKKAESVEETEKSAGEVSVKEA